MEFKFQGNLVEFKEKHRAGKLPVTASQRGKETESQHRGHHMVAGSHTGKKLWGKSQEAQGPGILKDL